MPTFRDEERRKAIAEAQKEPLNRNGMRVDSSPPSTRTAEQARQTLQSGPSIPRMTPCRGWRSICWLPGAGVPRTSQTASGRHWRRGWRQPRLAEPSQ
jgi:hypothetical protein